MLRIQTKNICKSYGDRLLFRLDALDIYAGDRIAIAGRNGAGKTTLMNVLAGCDAEAGSVMSFGRQAYVRQFDEVADKSGICGSGGELMRARLAAAFVSKPDILLIDEPTSNLDQHGIAWLEKQLTEFTGALILISHDRDLIDAVCTRILEVEAGAVTVFNGNYAFYQREKQLWEEKQAAEYAAYKAEHRRLTVTVRQKQEHAKTMRKAPTRMGNSEARLHKGKVAEKKGKLLQSVAAIGKRLDMLEKKEKPRKKPQVNFDLADRDGSHSKYLLRSGEFAVTVADKKLFQADKLVLQQGAKMALLGDNGSGKTTLLKMIIAQESTFQMAPGVRVGYFDQTLDNLQNEKTLLQAVMETSVCPETQVRTVLARLLFERSDLSRQVGSLSGGEKVKASLARIIVSDANFLILDEPTNYLDIPSLEALEEVLGAYTGSLLLVSHDRRFLSNVADSFLSISNGKLEFFDGSFAEWQQKQKNSATDSECREKLMRLENQMAVLLGRLCAPGKNDIKEELETQYAALAREISLLKASLDA